MNFISGGTIYHELENTGDRLDDYRNQVIKIEPNTLTRRLIEKEIITMNELFNKQGKELYVKKSDYEKRQLELYNQINELKHLLKQNISQEEFDHHFPTEPPF